MTIIGKGSFSLLYSFATKYTIIIEIIRICWIKIFVGKKRSFCVVRNNGFIKINSAII